jgi:hypothetical protein
MTPKAGNKAATYSVSKNNSVYIQGKDIMLLALSTAIVIRRKKTQRVLLHWH